MRRRGCGRGFSLLEVVVALALFVTAILAVVNLFPISARAIEQSRWRAQALEIAQMQMEMYVAQVTYDPSFTLTNGTYTSPTPTQVSVTSNGVGQDLTFNQTVTISTPASPNNVSNLHQVRVVVSYNYLTPAGTSGLEFVQLETALVAPP